MIIEEYTSENVPGITFTRAMSTFVVDGISYTPPYFLNGCGRQVARQMISVLPDDDGISWLSAAANTEHRDLDNYIYWDEVES